jgi:hypothetical protein
VQLILSQRIVRVLHDNSPIQQQAEEGGVIKAEAKEDEVEALVMDMEDPEIKVQSSQEVLILFTQDSLPRNKAGAIRLKSCRINCCTEKTNLPGT